MQKILNEYSLQSEIVDLLVSKQYPDESIITEWSQENTVYDLAIVEPKTNELLAIFELKMESPVVATTTNLRNKLKKFSDLVSGNNVPLYIVNAVQGHEGYSISRVLKKPSRPLFASHVEIPDYFTLRNSVLSNKKSSYLLSLDRIIFGAVIILSCFLFFEWIGLIDITPVRITIMGSIFGCLIIPYASKLKILGIEFEKDKAKTL